MKPYRYVGLCRLHLPDYNKAAWEIEGKYIYPEFKTYEEYRKAKSKPTATEDAQ